MNNMILCEGFDDVYFLGYYLFKTSGWTYKKDGKISELYEFPKVNFKNQVIEVYKKGADTLAIWCVGGKDHFGDPFKFLKKINDQHPQEGIGRIFIISDRDNSEIADCLKAVETKMKEWDLNVNHLVNNRCNDFKYKVENETFDLSVIPIFIPFEQTGELECVLMKAIQETGVEENFIVEEAIEYVDNLIHSGELKKYLQHGRLIPKAKFSSVISILSPDKSTAFFNALFMSFPWEKKDEIKKHFKILNDVLG